MFVGPVFAREAASTPRQPRHYLYRSVYVAVLMVLMCTAWMVTGSQVNRNVGDMARFGAMLFFVLAMLQTALAMFLSALHAASAVAQEKDRMTLILLLLTRLNNHEIVLGKLFASMLNVLTMLVASLPVFMMIVLFGGVSFHQVAQVFVISVGAALAAGSLGSMLALWREKTFQTLALTTIGIVLWLVVSEVVNFYGYFRLAQSLSPLRAVFAAARPDLSAGGLAWLASPYLFAGASILAAALLNAIAVLKVRVWNPSREVRRTTRGQEQASIWGDAYDLEQAQNAPAQTTAAGDQAKSRDAEQARSEHVDARVRKTSQTSRAVWNNPVLWREVCTWAYGRKVILIRIAYLSLFLLAGMGLQQTIASGAATARGDVTGATIPAAAMPLAPFFVVSLVVINALAVTSITNERDGRAMDLLLVTDLSPKEFVLGKLGGVLWITREMVGAPLLLCAYLYFYGGVSLENLIWLNAGLIVLIVFVAMLGIHCGMHYSNSRAAIVISLGSVFFLFLGVSICLTMMVSFSGSFQTQLAPFLAFIVGGSVGLYVALGIRNPSPAILTASVALPIATFYAIVSFLMEYAVYAFLATAAAYGFAAAAMLVPAISEFDIAVGRTKTAEDH